MMTIIKKELSRFFGDRRLLFTTMILPGLMIYLVYTVMGSALSRAFMPDSEYLPTVYVVGTSRGADVIEAAGIKLSELDASGLEGAKDEVAGQRADAVLVFPEGFDEAVEAYDPLEPAGPAPNVEIYYNSADAESYNIAMGLQSVLGGYEESMANKFDVNRGERKFDLAPDGAVSGQMMSGMLPMLLLMFLFSGSVAVAPESIAGEKERGTIATILVTPIKRWQLATGKIISLAVIASLCGISSMVGTILSLPKLLVMGGTDDISFSYGAGDYLALGLVVLSTVLLVVALISIISAFAKSVKEAGTYVAPFMAVVMLVGITPMFGGGVSSAAAYLIPVYNSAQVMSAIFSFDYAVKDVAITAASNLVYAFAGGAALAGMFSSEKIIFSK
jgi:sodium transport system permease protein